MGRSKCITAELMARSWHVMERSDCWTDGWRYWSVIELQYYGTYIMLLQTDGAQREDQSRKTEGVELE